MALRRRSDRAGRTLGVEHLLQIDADDRQDEVEVGPTKLRVLDHVVGARDGLREEVEDAVEDGEEEGVEHVEEVGLQEKGGQA